MADIDMIPRSYRDMVRVRRQLRQAGVALAAVAVLGLGANGALRWRGAAVARQAEVLEAAAGRAQADRARDADLQAASLRLQRDDATLQTLRREGELTTLMQGLETSLSDQVWLTGLTINRDAQAASAKDSPAAGIETLAGTGAAVQQTWRLASTLELKGQATDYAAVTAFLAALGRQPGVAGLRLVASSAGADGKTVDFEAAGYLVRPISGH